MTGADHEDGTNARASSAPSYRRADDGPPSSVAGDDDLITSWGLLSEAHVALTARLAKGLEATSCLTLPQFDVLIRLLRQPGHTLPLRQIAAETGLSSNGVAKLINHMELDQLIATWTDHEDHAVIEVSITERGRELTTAALDHHMKDLRRHLLEPLGVHRLRTLDNLTRTLRDCNVEQHSQTTAGSLPERDRRTR